MRLAIESSSSDCVDWSIGDMPGEIHEDENFTKDSITVIFVRDE